METSILTYDFMQRALLAGLLGGVTCSLIGVFVVNMQLSFIGVAISHAALAGALLGVMLEKSPLGGALLFSLLAAAIIGPLADRGEFKPDTPIGVVFSTTMGLAFLFMGLVPGPKTQALEILWGSILTVDNFDLVVLAAICALTAGVLLLFYKEIQAVLFHRLLALASGVPATLVFYGLLFLTGLTVATTLRSIGGLLIFNLILNPAAAAYQLTYSLQKMFLLSALFGVFSCWLGLFLSYYWDTPSGATIVLVSAGLFILCTALSPKRRVKKAG